LTQYYPGEMSGRMPQHVTPLAAFISGIGGSQSSQWPSMATNMADQAQLESRVKRLSRVGCPVRPGNAGQMELKDAMPS